jgi:hypothetical protein
MRPANRVRGALSSRRAKSVTYRSLAPREQGADVRPREVAAERRTACGGSHTRDEAAGESQPAPFACVERLVCWMNRSARDNRKRLTDSGRHAVRYLSVSLGAPLGSRGTPATLSNRGKKDGR